MKVIHISSRGIEKEVQIEIDKELYLLRRKFTEMREPMLQHARDLTSGNIPTREIKPNRPFARNNPDHTTIRTNYNGKRQKIRIPLIDGHNFPLLPINAQSKGLNENFATKVFRSGQTDIIELYNRKVYGKWILSLDGTPNMISRGFQERMKSRLNRIKL